MRSIICKECKQGYMLRDDDYKYIEEDIGIEKYHCFICSYIDIIKEVKNETKN